MYSSKIKFRYSINKQNQLIIKPDSPVATYFPKQLILDGYYELDKDAGLVFYPNVVSKEMLQDNGLPFHKVKLTGQWKLTPNYDLRLILDEGQYQSKGDRVTLKGELFHATHNSLHVSTTTSTSRTSKKIKVLTFNGIWRVTRNNTLSFICKQKNALKKGEFSFTAAWDINKKGEIVYAYTKESLVTKVKESHQLVIKGTWHIDKKNTLSYQVKGAKEQLYFKASLTTPLITSAKGILNFQVGIKGKTQRTIQNTLRNITFFGEWTIGRRLFVSYELQCREGKPYTMKWKLSVKNQKNKYILELLNKAKKPVGISLQISRTFFTSAHAFITCKKMLQEHIINFGVMF